MTLFILFILDYFKKRISEAAKRQERLLKINHDFEAKRRNARERLSYLLENSDFDKLEED